jgi:hypothetical protein
MTSEKNADNPSSIISEEGLTGEKSNTPYLETESKLGDLHETIDQPKLENPGSNDSNFISNILESIHRYTKETGVRAEDLAFYIVGIAVVDSSLKPSIFADDVRYAGSRTEIKCFMDIRDFIAEFSRRRLLFNSEFYEPRCVGLYNSVALKKDVNQMGYLNWPFAHLPGLRRPFEINPRMVARD